MKEQEVEYPAARSMSNSVELEQALCMDALTTGAYDEMSDEEWVAMCERVARENKASAPETAA